MWTSQRTVELCVSKTTHTPSKEMCPSPWEYGFLGNRVIVTVIIHAREDYSHVVRRAMIHDSDG